MFKKFYPLFVSRVELCVDNLLIHLVPLSEQVVAGHIGISVIAIFGVGIRNFKVGIVVFFVCEISLVVVFGAHSGIHLVVVFFVVVFFAGAFFALVLEAVVLRAVEVLRV